MSGWLPWMPNLGGTPKLNFEAQHEEDGPGDSETTDTPSTFEGFKQGTTLSWMPYIGGRPQLNFEAQLEEDDPGDSETAETASTFGGLKPGTKSDSLDSEDDEPSKGTPQPASPGSVASQRGLFPPDTSKSRVALRATNPDPLTSPIPPKALAFGHRDGLLKSKISLVENYYYYHGQEPPSDYAAYLKQLELEQKNLMEMANEVSQKAVSDRVELEDKVINREIEIDRLRSQISTMVSQKYSKKPTEVVENSTTNKKATQALRQPKSSRQKGIAQHPEELQVSDDDTLYALAHMNVEILLGRVEVAQTFKEWNHMESLTKTALEESLPLQDGLLAERCWLYLGIARYYQKLYWEAEEAFGSSSKYRGPHQKEALAWLMKARGAQSASPISLQAPRHDFDPLRPRTDSGAITTVPSALHSELSGLDFDSIRSRTSSMASTATADIEISQERQSRSTERDPEIHNQRQRERSPKSRTPARQPMAFPAPKSLLSHRPPMPSSPLSRTPKGIPAPSSPKRSLLRTQTNPAENLEERQEQQRPVSEVIRRVGNGPRSRRSTVGSREVGSGHARPLHRNAVANSMLVRATTNSTRKQPQREGLEAAPGAQQARSREPMNGTAAQFHQRNHDPGHYMKPEVIPKHANNANSNHARHLQTKPDSELAITVEVDKEGSLQKEGDPNPTADSSEDSSSEQSTMENGQDRRQPFNRISEQSPTEASTKHQPNDEELPMQNRPGQANPSTGQLKPLPQQHPSPAAMARDERESSPEDDFQFRGGKDRKRVYVKTVSEPSSTSTTGQNSPAAERSNVEERDSPLAAAAEGSDEDDLYGVEEGYVPPSARVAGRGSIPGKKNGEGEKASSASEDESDAEQEMSVLNQREETIMEDPEGRLIPLTEIEGVMVQQPESTEGVDKGAEVKAKKKRNRKGKGNQ